MKTVTLKIGNALEIRVNKKLVDIETTDKQWKIQFGCHTKEYAQILYILEQKDSVALQTLCNHLMFARLIVTDAKFLQAFHEMCENYINEVQIVDVDKEEDDKILKEERALHEQ